jgi:hypothetical protein
MMGSHGPRSVTIKKVREAFGVDLGADVDGAVKHSLCAQSSSCSLVVVGEGVVSERSCSILLCISA